MKIFTDIGRMRDFLRKEALGGKRIGFVPTMGYLHEGHLSLIGASRAECDITVVSIFVNPAQFGRGEDLDKYPEDIERDKVILKKEGVEVLFMPSKNEIYPKGYSTYVEVEGPISAGMCASSRKGHFKGVATVIVKLFNIVRPDVCFLGQKDAQQAAIIKQMVRDLDIPVDVKVMPIVREADGIAMSSRNKYLSSSERKKALVLFRSLKRAEEIMLKGEKSSLRIKKTIMDVLRSENGVKVDYVEIVDAATFLPVKKAGLKVIIAIAAFVGKTRLIDNIVI